MSIYDQLRADYAHLFDWHDRLRYDVGGAIQKLEAELNEEVYDVGVLSQVIEDLKRAQEWSGDGIVSLDKIDARGGA